MSLAQFASPVATLSAEQLDDVLASIQLTFADTRGREAYVMTSSDWNKEIVTSGGLCWADLLQASAVPCLCMPLTKERARAITSDCIYPCGTETFTDLYYLEYVPANQSVYVKYQQIIGSRLLGRVSDEQHAALFNRLVEQAAACGASPRYEEVRAKAARVRQMVSLRHSAPPAGEAAAPAALPPTKVLVQLSLMRAEGASLYLPEEMLSEYAAIKRLLETAGAKYSTKDKSFLLPAGRDAKQVLDQLLKGRSVNPKKDFQFFASTEAVKTVMSARVPNLTGLAVLEPSAGDGVLAEMARHMGATVTAIELWDENFVKLRAKGFTPLHRDFLQVTPQEIGQFDAILANPPFSGGQDIAHFMHMTTFLRPGATLSCVMSTGWRESNTKAATAFRKFLGEQDVVFDELPPGTFSASGTGVGAVVVTLHAANQPPCE